MSNTAGMLDGMETRKNMLRVWLAISAVWIAFWLVIAIIVLATVRSGYLSVDELQTFATIVVLPPIILLCLGLFGFTAFSLLVRAVPGRAAR